MEKVIIFDIDGTVADCTHRLHLVVEKRWDEFFEAADLDEPIGPMQELFNLVQDTPHKIAFVTARPNKYRSQTAQWLRKHRFFYNDLYMRPDDDRRSDFVVKREILDKIKMTHEVLFAIDDRTNVVDMYRRNGVLTLQCAPDDNVLKYKPGKLFMMVGPTGAGKTKYVKKHFSDKFVVSLDQLRMELNGNIHNQTTNQQVALTALAMIRARIEHGFDVVYDATNLRNADRKAVLNCLPDTASVEYIVINRSLDDKMQTGGNRRVDTIVKQDQVFRSNYKDIVKGDGDHRVMCSLSECVYP